MSVENTEPSWAREIKGSIHDLSKEVREIRDEVVRMEATSTTVATMREELTKVREQSLSTKVTLGVLAAALSLGAPFMLKAFGVLGGDSSSRVEQMQRELQGLQMRDRMPPREYETPQAWPPLQYRQALPAQQPQENALQGPRVPLRLGPQSPY